MTKLLNPRLIVAVAVLDAAIWAFVTTHNKSGNWDWAWVTTFLIFIGLVAVLAGFAVVRMWQGRSKGLA
jgi:type VI protein secretion system component VasK